MHSPSQAISLGCITIGLLFTIIFQDKEAVLNAVTFPSSGGSTDTAGAIQRMRDDVFDRAKGDRSGVINRAVIVTDGKSTEESETVQEAEAARDEGIEIYVVALGDSPRMSEINGMASDPDSDHVFFVEDVGHAESVADDVVQELCE